MWEQKQVKVKAYHHDGLSCSCYCSFTRPCSLAASCDEVERRENPDLTCTITKNTQNDFYLKGVVRTQ